jgi:hypothetical protein
MNNINYKKHLNEFISLYKTKPINDNTGGMKFPHMFATFCLLKELNPKLVIESGVWKGQGTWLIEKTCPQAQIISIDPNPGVRVYTSKNSYYTTDDITSIDWKQYMIDNQYEIDDVVVFLDDHQNVLDRLKFLVDKTNIKHILYEDNYPSNQGDCLSLKKLKSNKPYVIDYAGERTYYEMDPKDVNYFNSIINTYFEFPPIYKPEYTRWGDKWDEIYDTPKSICKDIETSLIEFQSEFKDYTWFCYLKLN